MFTVEDSGNCLKQLEIVTASFVLLLGYTFSISEYYQVRIQGGAPGARAPPMVKF